MAMKQLSKAIGLAAMAASGVVLADTPTLKQVLDASGITATGYIDAAYVHQRIDPNDQVGVSIPNYFDNRKDSFDLKQASVTFSSLPKEGFGALINLTAGSDARWIHSAPTSTGDSADQFDVTQAFVQYATGPVTAVAGKFNTLAGAEVIAPTGNTNITHSIAFLNAIPFTHTGVRFSYAPADIMTLYFGVNNGWDQQTDNNNNKTLELGVALTPSPMVSWTIQAYNGKEVTTSGTNANRLLIDTVLTIKPIDPLSIVINFDSGKQEQALSDGTDAKWTALVGYVNYAFTSEWHMSLRAEAFNDKNDYRLGMVDLTSTPDALANPNTIGNQDPNKKTKEYTLTVGYAPSANFEIRGEVRQDRTDKEALVTTSGGSTDKATTLALETYYKF